MRDNYPKIQKTYSGEMQVSVPNSYGGANVYNFSDANNQAHSHIYYPNRYDDSSRQIHRTLSNAKHDWVIPGYAYEEYVSSTYEFDYIYESISKRFLSLLTKEQLIELRKEIENNMIKNKKKTLNR